MDMEICFAIYFRSASRHGPNSYLSVSLSCRSITWRCIPKKISKQYLTENFGKIYPITDKNDFGLVYTRSYFLRNPFEISQLKSKQFCKKHVREGLFKFTKHTTDLDFAQCLTYSTNLFQRLTLD